MVALVVVRVWRVFAPVVSFASDLVNSVFARV